MLPTILNNSSGSAGFRIPDSGVISIPEDYSTLTEAFEAIDAAGGVFGSKQLTIQLPDTAGTPIEEYFHWENKDYSNISLKGASPSLALVGTVDSVTGTSGAYDVTISFPAGNSFADEAATKGYITIENENANTGINDNKLFGTWKVLSTSGNSVTMRNTCDGALPIVQPSGISMQGTVHGTVMQSTISSTPIFALVFSKSPVIEDLLLVGNGTQNLVHAAQMSVFRTSLRSGGQLSASYYALHTHGGQNNVAITGESTFIGSLSTSAAVTGIYTQTGVIRAYGMQSTGNSAMGIYVASGGIFRSSNGWSDGIYCNFSGNGDYGVSVTALSTFQCTKGVIAGNGTIDLRVTGNSLGYVTNGSQMTLGSTSPVIDTLGNDNSYIQA